MSTLVMLYGASGTGKSTALRNFKPEEVAVINVSGKPLPFRNPMQTYVSDDYDKIMAAIKKTQRKAIVIDDATYLMVNELFRTAKQTGYQKFTEMALNFKTLVDTARSLPDDKVVYFIGHTERNDEGQEHFKTVGKMIDSYVTLEGMFTVVFKTEIRDGKYLFATRNNGQDTVKTPMGMFEEEYIDNDLKLVDTRIREYWNIGEEKKENDTV